MADHLQHYGTPRHSGRYPWGSGEDPYQSSISFMAAYRQLKAKGLSQTEIARGLGFATNKDSGTGRLRARISLANAEIHSTETRTAMKLKDKGWSNSAIGRQMGKSESSIRNLLNPVMQERAKITRATMDMLKDTVDKHKYIDISLGSEGHIGVSRQRLLNSVAELVEQGYIKYQIKIPQLNSPGQYTTMNVLGAPDTTYREVVKDKTLIHPITGKSDDFGRTYRSVLGLEPIQSVSSDRVSIRYYEDGGSDKDGVIELRKGVSDLDLGKSQYAQVRIGVDDTHYLKGMAVYSDNLPKGVDILFNTNKHEGTPMLGSGSNTVLKPMKKNQDGEIDQDNPFGAAIKRENGQRGALNIVTEEGDWGSWSKVISSQLLSKQPPALAKQQLELTRSLRQEEFDEYLSLTNPAIKKQLLESFADGCDASAAHLEAAGLPRQRWHAILPVTSIKENEVYAPNYDNGDTVVLIRYPHGGKFEIPQLTVNNNNLEAKSIIGEQAIDAVGIHPSTAKKLSGADFDGDTVLVIPNKSGAIKSTGTLQDLKDFDPIEAYRLPPHDGPDAADYAVGGKYNKFNRGQQMGSVSNLITDMTIKGANGDEIARAVKHSMVVIDAEKHNLDFKQSYIDNGIASLKRDYQGSSRSGASTIISKSEAQLTVPDFKPGAAIGPINKRTGLPTKLYVDPETGEKLYTPTGITYEKMKKVPVPEGYVDPRTGKTLYVKYEPTGKIITKTKQTTPMAMTKDAHTLSSGTRIEYIYAEHANELKAMANKARKEALSVKPTPYSPSAKKAYEEEVSSLIRKIKIYEANKPLERQAQIIAGDNIRKKKLANPGLSKEDIKKMTGQALAEARARTGRAKYEIEITPREWEAIQAGAVASDRLRKILDGANLDTIKKYATPRTTKGISSAKEALAKSMAAKGYTQAEIADQLGISTSTIADIIK